MTLWILIALVVVGGAEAFFERPQKLRRPYPGALRPARRLVSARSHGLASSIGRARVRTTGDEARARIRVEMSRIDLCPCGSGLDYGACCQPRHAGIRPAETAEALMRSRYAAFVRGEIAYLVRTLHPAKRSLDTAAELRQVIESTRWTGLRVLDTEAGTEVDAAGEVEFVAFFEAREGPGQLHERSAFRRENEAWLYVDASPSCQCEPPARNAPCWCGSGARYRRCHGRERVGRS